LRLETGSSKSSGAKKMQVRNWRISLVCFSIYLHICIHAQFWVY
jgi:hypothetical protein